jgi:uncharacterized protein (DUF1499 family)
MTTASPPASRAGAGPYRGAAVLGFVLALAALLMLAAGPFGWRAGWWHYRLGLQTLMPYAFYVGVAGMAISALALIGGVQGIARRGIILAVLGVLIGGTAAYLPWHWNGLRAAFPRVNDITTDFDNPPSLAFAEGMRKAEHGNPVAYGGTKLTTVQKKSYPDIVPEMLDLPPAQAFDRALAVAQARGWSILKADPAAGIIEASERSRWYGFTDDIAVRITPLDSGSRVDIRSGARQGGGDFGVNATRVRGFLAALHAAAQKS